MVKVELRPHMGESMRRGKLVEVSVGQQRVFVEGDFCGYVGDEPGSPFCPTLPPGDFNAEELAAIEVAVTQFHGGVTPRASSMLPDEPEAEPESEPVVDVPDEEEIVTVTDEA